MSEVITEQAALVAILRKWGCGDAWLLPEIEWLNHTINKMNVWLDRGDGIAVYRNEDFGHPELGDLRFMSYGSRTAQLEVEEPPTRLPDGPGGDINWRYQLAYTYMGPMLEMPQEGQ